MWLWPTFSMRSTCSSPHRSTLLSWAFTKDMGLVLGSLRRSAPRKVALHLPSRGEPCRYDLREGACFPYPPPENQGDSVTCVAHSFATALYCVERKLSAHLAEYPELDNIFVAALNESPDKTRGVSFEAIARGVEKVYGRRMKSLGAAYKKLPNSAAEARAALLSGSPVIAGYQVDEEIDAFHRNAHECERLGFLLPLFRSNSESISGHAVLLLGYDFSVQALIARNSWGKDWGVDGHFLVPFEAIEDSGFFTDLWTLEFKLPRL